MITVGPNGSTWVTVFTAAYDGIYAFTADGAGSFPGNFRVQGAALRTVYPVGVHGDQYSMTMAMTAGDELQHQSGTALLSGVRLGDEL